MERQFSYVKRYTIQDHPFRDFNSMLASDSTRLDQSMPPLPVGKHPEIVKENFLTLYCLQDDC